jgi:hypothetical protein
MSARKTENDVEQQEMGGDGVNTFGEVLYSCVKLE